MFYNPCYSCRGPGISSQSQQQRAFDVLDTDLCVSYAFMQAGKTLIYVNKSFFQKNAFCSFICCCPVLLWTWCLQFLSLFCFLVIKLDRVWAYSSFTFSFLCSFWISFSGPWEPCVLFPNNIWKWANLSRKDY